MEILKTRTNYLEIEELACKILGLDYDDIDADTDVINEKMDEDCDIHAILDNSILMLNSKLKYKVKYKSKIKSSSLDG